MRLTQEYLKSILHYDPENGIWTWLVPKGPRAPTGSHPGTLHHSGYVLIMIDKFKYMAHRLAWLYMTGNWPSNDIDHIDTVKHHNQWSNLRAATKSQNGGNIKRPVTNTSGKKGVTWNKKAGKWHSQIRINNKRTYLGFFDDIELAAEAYRKAAVKHFGVFARIE